MKNSISLLILSLLSSSEEVQAKSSFFQASICTLLRHTKGEICTLGGFLEEDQEGSKCKNRTLFTTHLNNPATIHFPFNFENPNPHRQFAHHTILFKKACQPSVSSSSYSESILGMNSRLTTFRSNQLAPSTKLEFPHIHDNDLAVGLYVVGKHWDDIEQLAYSPPAQAYSESIDSRILFLHSTLHPLVPLSPLSPIHSNSPLTSLSSDSISFKRNGQNIPIEQKVVVLCDDICNSPHENPRRRSIIEASVMLDGFTGGSTVRNLQVSVPSYPVFNELQRLEASTSFALRISVPVKRMPIETQVRVTLNFLVVYQTSSVYSVTIVDSIVTPVLEKSLIPGAEEMIKDAVSNLQKEIAAFKLTIAVRDNRSNFVLVNEKGNNVHYDSLNEILALIPEKSIYESIFYPFLFFSKEASVLLRTVLGEADGGMLKYFVEGSTMRIVNNERLLDIDFGFENILTPTENYDLKRKHIENHHRLKQQAYKQKRNNERQMEKIIEQEIQLVQEQRTLRKMRPVDLKAKLNRKKSPRKILQKDLEKDEERIEKEILYKELQMKTVGDDVPHFGSNFEERDSRHVEYDVLDWKEEQELTFGRTYSLAESTIKIDPHTKLPKVEATTKKINGFNRLHFPDAPLDSSAAQEHPLSAEHDLTTAFSREHAKDNRMYSNLINKSESHIVGTVKNNILTHTNLFESYHPLFQFSSLESKKGESDLIAAKVLSEEESILSYFNTVRGEEERYVENRDVAKIKMRTAFERNTQIIIESSHTIDSFFQQSYEARVVKNIIIGDLVFNLFEVEPIVKDEMEVEQPVDLPIAQKRIPGVFRRKSDKLRNIWMNQSAFSEPLGRINAVQVENDENFADCSSSTLSTPVEYSIQSESSSQIEIDVEDLPVNQDISAAVSPLIEEIQAIYIAPLEEIDNTEAFDDTSIAPVLQQETAYEISEALAISLPQNEEPIHHAAPHSIELRTPEVALPVIEEKNSTDSEQGENYRFEVNLDHEKEENLAIAREAVDELESILFPEIQEKRTERLEAIVEEQREAIQNATDNLIDLEGLAELFTELPEDAEATEISVEDKIAEVAMEEKIAEVIVEKKIAEAPMKEQQPIEEPKKSFPLSTLQRIKKFLLHRNEKGSSGKSQANVSNEVTENKSNHPTILGLIQTLVIITVLLISFFFVWYSSPRNLRLSEEEEKAQDEEKLPTEEQLLV